MHEKIRAIEWPMDHIRVVDGVVFVREQAIGHVSSPSQRQIFWWEQKRAPLARAL